MTKFEFGNIDELRWPREVWKAVEGDNRDLIALLRGDRALSRRVRNALADWLDEKLQPARQGRGRRRSYPEYILALIARSAHGRHNVDTKLGRAGHRYEKVRSFIRAKRWHLKHRGWKERLVEAVAREERVSAEALREYLRRGAPRVKPFKSEERQLEARLEIAREIHAAKSRRKRPNKHG